MAKAVTKALTFLDQLEVRHDAFQAIEESGALQIRHELASVKAKALRTVEASLAKISEQGNVKTTTEALRRAKGIVADVDDLVARGFGSVDGKLLSLKEAAFQKGLQDFEIAAHSIPGAPELGLTTSFEQIFPEAAEAALTNPVMGVSATSTWNGVIGGTQQKVQQTLLGAVVTGESIDATLKKLSDAMDISAAAAERIARTGLNAMYNDAHIAAINANPDIFVGYRWLAALDDRTSAICIRLHGSFFPLGSIPPGPPAHWNCRSIVQPVFRDPAIQAEMMSDTQRVKNYKADGTVKQSFIKTSTSSEKWLRRQPQWVQRKVLGSKTKADLFKTGKATIEDIVSPAMEVLSDKALIRRMAALRPGDKSLQALAKSQGIRVPSKKTIAAQDKALANKQTFVQPTEMPDPNAAPAVPAPEPAAPVAPAEPAAAATTEDLEELARVQTQNARRLEKLERESRALELKVARAGTELRPFEARLARLRPGTTTHKKTSAKVRQLKAVRTADKTKLEGIWREQGTLRKEIAGAPKPATAPKPTLAPKPVAPKPITQSKWTKSLSTDERTAVEDWITADWQRTRALDTVIGDDARLTLLRTEFSLSEAKAQEVLSQYKNLNSAMARAPVSKKRIYRGIADIDEATIKRFETSDTIQFDSRVSTSSRKQVADEFASYGAGDGDTVVFQIDDGLGNPIDQIADAVGMEDQFELLMPKGNFKVTKRRWEINEFTEIRQLEISLRRIQ